MSRVVNSFRNIKISVLFIVLTFLVSFFYRAIFIQSIGDKLVGLTSTIMNMLGFFNLAELGLSTAISGTLYSALYSNNQKKIIDIVSIFGYLYRIIGFIILSAGIVFSFFLPTIFGGAEIGLLEVYVCFFTFLSTSLIGYFISYRQTVLIADQKEYIVTMLTNCFIICKQILQIILLKWIINSYIVLLIIELLFGISYGFWINTRVKKYYPWLKTSFSHGKEISKDYKGLFRTIKNLIPHNVSSFIIFQMDSILIFTFVSLQTVTLYTNYAMILLKLPSLVSGTFRGSVASVGNLIAEGNKDQIKKVFMEYNALFFLLGGVICTCTFFLMKPFITLWLGAEYILDDITFYFFLFNTYVGFFRQSVSYFITGYVLYKDVWAPITEAAIKLIISITLGYFWGIKGIIIGTTVSYLIIIVFWKPYFLFREGIGEKIVVYWKAVIKYIILLAVAIICVYPIIYLNILFEFTNFIYFFINAIILFISIGGVYWSLMYALDQGARDISHRIFGLIKIRASKNK